MNVRQAVVAACIGVAVGACAPRPVTLPSSGVPEPQAAAFQATATEACRGARTFSAEWRVNGRVGDERVPGVTLQGAMTRDGRITLRAVAPVGAPIFVMGGQASRAVLVLPRDRRYVEAAAADIVEALIGLRLAPVDWIDLMAGCGAAGVPGAGVRVGRDVVLAVGESGRVRLHPEGSRWRVVAAERADARVEYREFAGRWPSEARFTSRPGAAVALTLRVRIGQVFVNTDLPARAFEAPATAGMEPMSLATLRSAGPLGGKGGH